MIIAYIRVSTDKQNKKNQRYEILNYADNKKIKIDRWVEESVSSRKKLKERKLYNTLQQLEKEDILICSEVSRLGRSIMEVMSILNILMEKEVKLYTIKEKYELGNNVSSQVLAFAFSLSAQIEKDMISQRTKEALARKKSEGKKLGRPKGSLSKITKLTGKEELIQEYLNCDVSISAIARLFKVDRKTVSSFIKSRNITKQKKEKLTINC